MSHSIKITKGQVIRATFSCNLWRNIVAKFCCPYYHPRKQLVKQQDLLPKVEPTSTSCNMLLQLATLKFVARQVACGVVIRATKLCNLQSNNVARQVARKCCPYYLTLRVMKSLQNYVILRPTSVTAAQGSLVF